MAAVVAKVVTVELEVMVVMAAMVRLVVKILTHFQEETVEILVMAVESH